MHSSWKFPCLFHDRAAWVCTRPLLLVGSSPFAMLVIYIWSKVDHHRFQKRKYHDVRFVTPLPDVSRLPPYQPLLLDFFPRGNFCTLAAPTEPSAPSPLFPLALLRLKCVPMNISPQKDDIYQGTIVWSAKSVGNWVLLPTFQRMHCPCMMGTRARSFVARNIGVSLIRKLVQLVSPLPSRKRGRLEDAAAPPIEERVVTLCDACAKYPSKHEYNMDSHFFTGTNTIRRYFERKASNGSCAVRGL